MESIKNFLISIGFGKNETEVYAALVDMGKSSVLDISKQTKIHRSNIYDSLRSLVEKGVVFESNEATKLFYARPPSSLINYLKQKEAELEEIIKEYEKRKSVKEVKEDIRVSKGTFALREAINSLLTTGEPIFVYGIPEKAPEVIGPIIKEFHKERIKKKIVMKHIYTSLGEDRIEYLKKMDNTYIKILPQETENPATTNISGEKVIIILWENGPTIVEITNRQMAETYHDYFEILWKKAKEF